MTLTRRERILLLATIATLVLAAGWFFFPGLVGPPERLRRARASAAAELDRRQQRLDATVTAGVRLEAWKRRSLPSDPHTARSLYQNWLLAQLSAANLRELKVASTGDIPVAGIYDRLVFTVNGRATAEQLTEFLHAFYAAGHLHKIRSASMMPIKDTTDLDVNLTIEALCLPGADRTDRLTDVKSDRLADAEAKRYVDVIGGRRLFSSTVSPDAQTSKTSDIAQAVKDLTVTGTGAIDGQQQVWLRVVSTDERMRTYEGGVFMFKKIQGKVLRVLPRGAELEIDGRRWFVPLGESLEKAKPLDETLPRSP